MSGLLFVINYNGHLVYMMSLMLDDQRQVSHSSRSASLHASYKRFTQKPENLRLSCLKVPMFQISRMCKCRGKSRAKRLLSRDYDQLRKEVDIVRVLKTLMVLRAFAKH